jgi:hypothetical protein
MRLLRDERGIVIDWLIKLIVFLAIAGVVLFDGGSILVNRLTATASAEDVAAATASDIAFSGSRPNQQALEELASEQAADFGVKLLEVTLDTEGILSVRVRKRATTILANKIGFLKKYLRATGSAQSSINPQ